MKSQNACEQTKHKTWRALLDALPWKPAAWLLLLGVMLAWAAPAQAGQPFGHDDKRGVDVMQVNLYIGGGIDRVMALDPSDPNYLTELVTTVTGIYYEIVASQPATRLQGVADAIAARRPDFVSVEEASLIRVQSPGDLVYGGKQPATTVVFDYLQILTNALAADGAHYAVVSLAGEIDIEMPMINLQTGNIDDVRWNDREAILVRTDLPRGQLRVTNPQSGNFANVIEIPGTGISVTRGWCSVDVCMRGELFRYICTHLEEETAPQLQILQARELLGGPARTRLPVLIAGDFNADPLHRDGSLAYDTFTRAGFRDAWAAVHRRNPTGGLTWGHDEFLADPTVRFDRRIDLLFYKEADFVPQSADVLDLWLGRNTAPLWASDHAAVSAEFQLK